MCYSNCPNETRDGDCRNLKIAGRSTSHHCYIYHCEACGEEIDSGEFCAECAGKED
jgi:hypothetical protein